MWAPLGFWWVKGNLVVLGWSWLLGIVVGESWGSTGGHGSVGDLCKRVLGAAEPGGAPCGLRGDVA